MIKIASVGRRANPSGRDPYAAVSILYFDTQSCKLVLRYRETNGKGTQKDTPDHCTIHHLNQFVRDQDQLFDNSYYIRTRPAAAWFIVINSIIGQHKDDRQRSRRVSR